MYNRFSQDKIFEGKEASILKDNVAFTKAVEQVLNRYAQIEEDVLMDIQENVREVGAKVKHFAMMRKSLIDVVRELDSLIIEGDNASMDKDDIGE